MEKHYRNLLIFELIVIVLVTLIFRLIESRLAAGRVAGAVFLSLGFYVVLTGLRMPRGRWRSASFLTGLIFFFGVALPLVVSRFIQSETSFEQVRVLGLPGPVFHRVSTAIYLVLMAATVWDWFRAGRRERTLLK